MVVGQRQPPLLFHPRQLFGKARRVAGQPLMVFAPCQVIPLHKTGIDRRAGSRCGKSSINLCRLPQDKLAGHFDHPSFFTPLDHRGIQQVRQGFAPRGRISSPIPLSLRLIPFPIRRPQGRVIGRPLVTGKEGYVIIGHLHHVIQEPVRVRRRAVAHDQRHHQATPRVLILA